MTGDGAGLVGGGPVHGSREDLRVGWFAVGLYDRSRWRAPLYAYTWNTDANRAAQALELTRQVFTAQPA